MTIPGRTSLRFDGAQMTLVDNARYEPEQVLLMTSSSPVAEQAFAGKVQAYLLPVRHPNQPKEDKDPYNWSDEGQIGNDILAKSQSLPLTYVASDGGDETTHGFKFNAPVGRYLFLWVKEGVQGTGGYISGKPYTATIQVTPYRQALTFLGKGALLSLAGDRKVGFLVRDVDKVRVEVGRVLPNQLQHLAPQMWDFSKPQVSGTGGFHRRALHRHARLPRPASPANRFTTASISASTCRTRRRTSAACFLLHIRSVPPEENTQENDGWRQKKATTPVASKTRA